jgi:hypothetical protein
MNRVSQYGISKKSTFLDDPEVLTGGLYASPKDSKFFMKATKRKNFNCKSKPGPGSGFVSRDSGAANASIRIHNTDASMVKILVVQMDCMTHDTETSRTPMEII